MAKPDWHPGSMVPESVLLIWTCTPQLVNSDTVFYCGPFHKSYRWSGATPGVWSWCFMILEAKMQEEMLTHAHTRVYAHTHTGPGRH